MPTDATLAADSITLELQPLPTIAPSNVPKAVSTPVVARNLFATAPTVAHNNNKVDKPAAKASSPTSAARSRPLPAYFDDNDVLMPGPGMSRVRKPYRL